MTNYGSDLVLAMVMVIAFFVVLIFWVTYGGVAILGYEKFDPEEEVCIDKDYLDAVERFREKVKKAIEEKDLTFDFSIAPDFRLCKEWRPKNECEKENPDYHYTEEIYDFDFIPNEEIVTVCKRIEYGGICAEYNSTELVAYFPDSEILYEGKGVRKYKTLCAKKYG